jgi:FHA domain
MSVSLILRCGTQRLPLSGHPVAIGRLPECDVALEGAEVSRRHARIVPTPEGPLLVDRSRFGTFVNGAQVIAPSLLVAGDVILIGKHEMVVELADPRHAAEASGGRAGWRRRSAAWRRRYGLAELAGTAALVVVTLAVRRMTASIVVAALAGSLAEACWFYAVLLVREYRLERRDAQVGGFERRSLGDLGRDLLLEFGAAERLDGLLLRPLCLGLGLRLVGGWLGVLLGKLAADLLFYGPVLALLHWRGGRPGGRGPGDGNNLRQTSATGFPLFRE